MDFQLEDDDPDAAAMAEAMGFSGFGNQRPAKRKFNANADAAVSSSREKKSGNVSKTGANNAPLGVRRPLQLSPPTSASLLAQPGESGEEIGLGEDEAAGVDNQLETMAFDLENKFISTLQTPGGYQSEDTDSMVAQPPMNTVVDNGPPGLPSRPPHQQGFQRSHSHQYGRGGRTTGRNLGAAGTANSPWWEGYYDAKMNENPWEKIERERGLRPRGTWVATNVGHHHPSVTTDAKRTETEVLNGSADAAAKLHAGES